MKSLVLIATLLALSACKKEEKPVVVVEPAETVVVPVPTPPAPAVPDIVIVPPVDEKTVPPVPEKK